MMIDIILFAAFAAFIGFKLFNALGKKDLNHDLNSGSDVKSNTVVDLNSKQDVASESEVELIKDDYNDLMMRYNTKIAKGLTEINSLENTFNEKSFLDGANYAFEYVLKAFSNGDKEVLKNLLKDELFKDFESIIDERKDSDSVQIDTLVAILETNIKDVVIDGKIAKIDVEFISEQINIVKNTSP